MISGCLMFECTKNVDEYKTLVLGLQRTINLNMDALKVIVHPVNSVDVVNDITTNEGEHEQPLKTTAKGKKGNIIPKGVVSLNKIYDLQKLCQGPRNNRSHWSTTTNKYAT